ncbi:WG repeat-containing protein [Olleya sp. YS]|uniref:WG repeat-containing protein n=1 Tax=Olleya sp. YS TaxID=3028318 RepID=UPI00243452BA|nr:WG repeat-containing protein [Olleya sp. YS]WGD34419.1 WG repeat-containing protein [Olleya sp. YS]
MKPYIKYGNILTLKFTLDVVLSKRRFKTFFFNFNQLKIMRAYLLLLLCFNFIISVTAQTIGSDQELMEEELMEVPIEEVKTDENTIWQFKENGKIGFKVNKQVVVQPIYDEVYYLNKESFIVKKGQFYGVIDKTFHPIIPIKYDKLEKKYFGNYILATKNNKQGTFDIDGKKILSVKYNNIVYCNPELNIGLIKDEDENIFFIYKNEKKLKAPLSKVSVYKNAIIARTDNKFGVLGESGIIIPFEFDAIAENLKNLRLNKTELMLNKSNYDINLLTVYKEDKYGLITPEGKEILPTIYNKIAFDSGRNLYNLTKEDKKGIYFKTSKTLLPTIYDNTYTSGRRFVILTKDKLKGAINYNGEIILPIEFDNISVHGLSTSFKVSKNKKVGWYNNKGEVIIPPLYDEMDDFYQSGFSNFYEVRIGKQKGIIAKNGETILPVEFEYVFPKSNFFIAMKDDKRGLYNKQGKQILPVEYNSINETSTKQSNLLYATNTNSTIFINKKTGTQLFDQGFKGFGYIYNQNKLINPFNENGKTFLLVQSMREKFGVIDETNLTINIPLIYDQILQKFETDNATYYIAKKGHKFGVINHQNKTIIPFDYQFIEFGFMSSYIIESINFVAKKNNKFGLLDLKGNQLIPFKYKALTKISLDNLFKAKAGEHYKLINLEDKTLNAGPFDQIANFESNEAQTFYNGEMRVINKDGKFLTPNIAMQPHNGFDTFEALKLELIDALNDKNDDALKLFAKKIAPSKHLLRYVSKNIFNDKPLSTIDTDYAVKRYYDLLLEFKYRTWNDERFYDKSRLMRIDEFTYHRTYYGHSIVTNTRRSDPAYGDTRILEKLLRKSIKINGYWISSFFMDRRFYRN